MANYKNLRTEPPDRAVGRSRGGLSTKIHELVDGHGLLLVVLVGAGRLAMLRCSRSCCTTCASPGVVPDGRAPGPRQFGATRPTPPRAIRGLLRSRGIRSCIPEPADQQGHRQRRGSQAGRPVSYDTKDDKGRNVVEHAFNQDKRWRGLATRYDKLATVYRAGSVLRAILFTLRRLEDMPLSSDAS